ncbi:MAG: glycosyltransferase [Bacteroidia bacterium]|nr:glycosyltransferase [Bacteroidia bacterium]
MQTDYDVIILGLSRWDNSLNSSTFCIAKEFAKKQRVFYIDRPFSLKDYLQEKQFNPISIRRNAILTGKNIYKEVEMDGIKFTCITPRMSIPVNIFADSLVYDLLSLYNLQLVSKVIKRTILDFNIKKYVYLNSFLPTYFDVIPKDTVQPLVKIYRSCDDISQEKYIAKHGIRKEIEAVEDADLVIASSFELCHKLGKFGKKVHRVSNAADTNMFNSIFEDGIQKPDELLDAKGKIIMYTGRLSLLRIDYELLVKIAVSRPNDTLVIIGPYEEKDIAQFKLDKFSNVILTGRKPMNQLYKYLKFADCTIIPFLNNTLTKSIYPLKINEYLACGLPVVSTNFSEDIRSFGDFIAVKDTHDEFIQAIEERMILHDGDTAKRNIALSLKNTWVQRVELLRDLIADFNN